MTDFDWLIIGGWGTGLLVLTAARLGLLTIKLGPAAKPRAPKEPTP